MNVDAVLNYPSLEPDFFTVFVIINLYLSGLAWCLSTLFFRSYLTYPLNFWSSEYDIEVYDDLIQSLPIKGWFMDYLTMRWHLPQKILWTDVSSIMFSGGRLKTEFGKSELSIVSVLKKVTAVYESLSNKLDLHTESLEIISKNDARISINLWELNMEERLQLFHLIRKNAPSIYLDEKVQNALTGSTVLREPKYTEIWFSVLANDNTNFLEGDLKVGKMLRRDRYRVTSKLASGGQAVVYSASDENGQTVVLKEFQLTTGESLDVQIESAKDFENESAILDQLSHPGIVKSLDIFYEDGRVYLVLENVEGKSLRELVTENGRLLHSEIVDLATQMCDVLKYLHAQEPPVVHRDFTPDNIILQPDGKLKLIDFSIAQCRKDPSSSDCAGKHSYTPPEQFRGAACPQSDIYALGATLYFLSTGNDPEPISTSRLPESQSTDSQRLSDIIAKATELDLQRRYESVDWLQLSLQSVSPNEERLQDDTSSVIALSKIYRCGIVVIPAKPNPQHHFAPASSIKLRRQLA